MHLFWRSLTFGKTSCWTLTQVILRYAQFYRKWTKDKRKLLHTPAKHCQSQEGDTALRVRSCNHTDLNSLRWFTNFKSPEGHLARWLEVLQPMIWKYKTGLGSNTGMPVPWVAYPVARVERWKFWKNWVMFYRYERQILRLWISQNRTFNRYQGQDEELDTIRKW